jgi:DNA-binding transcriptional ArsR family regulator
MSSPGLRPVGATASERLALYQTWNHPIRRRILGHLAHYGPANSTVLAEALGESTGTTSYHLRKLAEQDLVEEVEERSTGRERWWRAGRIVFRTPPRSEMTPEELAASEHLSNLKAGHDIELYLRSIVEYDSADGWVDGDRFGTFLTKEEVRRFVEDYHALIARYSRSAEDAPEGARSMAVRFFVVPELPPELLDPDSGEVSRR